MIRRSRKRHGDYTLHGGSEQLNGLLTELLDAHSAHYARAQLDWVLDATAFAHEQHSDQQRDSGEPFLVHPLSVALHAARLGLDTDTLIAAILHDTVEDTKATLPAVLLLFGKGVADLVDGVTKFETLTAGSNPARSLQKLLAFGASDPRVFVIKLLDRLHNLRTLQHRPPDKRIATAEHTLNFIVPIAERLGVRDLRIELEELAWAYLEPSRVQGVKRRQDEGSAATRAAHLGRVRQLERVLAEVVPAARVSWEQRSLASVLGSSGEVGMVVPRLRIVCGERTMDCYVAMGAVSAVWAPVPGSMRDFIAMPRFGLYQALHMTVAAPQTRRLRCILLTQHMNQVAQEGILVPWKEHIGSDGLIATGAVGDLRGDVLWARRILGEDAADLARAPRGTDGTSAEDERAIRLVTPDGAETLVPAGTTVLEYVYLLGEQVGDQVASARVNGVAAPLGTPLEDGDYVELALNGGARKSRPAPEPPARPGREE